MLTVVPEGIRVQLLKGTCGVASGRSPDNLYRQNYATFSRDSVYNQNDADGFNNLVRLAPKVMAPVDRRASLAGGHVEDRARMQTD